MKHPVFDELSAFDPRWQIHYASGYLAAKAARCLPLWYDFEDSPEGRALVRKLENVPDYLAEIRALQDAEANSSLPFKLNAIGKVPGGG